MQGTSCAGETAGKSKETKFCIRFVIVAAVYICVVKSVIYITTLWDFKSLLI